MEHSQHVATVNALSEERHVVILRKKITRLEGDLDAADTLLATSCAALDSATMDNQFLREQLESTRGYLDKIERDLAAALRELQDTNLDLVEMARLVVGVNDVT